MNRFHVLTVSALLLYTVAVQASAPIGAAPTDADAAMQQSDLVFMGRVEQVQPDGLGYPSHAVVRVVSSWKGNTGVSGTVRVDGAGGPTEAARIFEVGKSYLFYLNSNVKNANGELRADSYLNRVLPEENAGEDLARLQQTKRLRSHH